MCKEVLEQGKSIEKLAHNYKDGKCSVCGAVDPNNKPAEPADGGSNAPTTGDSSHIALWITVLAASGLGLGAVAIFFKKRRCK